MGPEIRKFGLKILKLDREIFNLGLKIDINPRVEPKNPLVGPKKLQVGFQNPLFGPQSPLFGPKNPQNGS